MTSWIRQLALKALNVALRFRVGRWIVGNIITLLIRVALPALARFIAALLAPMLRSFPISRDTLLELFEHVATLYRGGSPVYADLEGYLADEVQELAESLFEILNVLRTEYGITVTNANLATLLDAVAARLAPQS